MSKLLWFVLGIGGGFVLAHFVDKDPRGHEVLAEVDARISEFTDRIADAYHDQESRLADVAATVSAAASDAVASVRDAASDAVDTAADAAAKLTD